MYSVLSMSLEQSGAFFYPRMVSLVSTTSTVHTSIARMVSHWYILVPFGIARMVPHWYILIPFGITRMVPHWYILVP